MGGRSLLKLLIERDALDEDFTRFYVAEVCPSSFMSSRCAAHYFQMILTIESCHRHGFIHRDIKPDNFLFDPEFGHIRLSDFGLASVSIVSHEDY